MNEGPQYLYLVRHGRTALNAEGRLRGLANPSLDEIGHAEAEAAALALEARGIDIVYCSPLERAFRTAQVIANHLDCDFDVMPAFNDRDYGPWTGHVKADVEAEFGSVDAAPGVEPIKHVLQRAWPALDEALDPHPGVAVCVVTHDALIRPLLSNVDPRIGPIEARTGSWNELVRQAGAWSVLKYDQNPEPVAR